MQDEEGKRMKDEDIPIRTTTRLDNTQKERVKVTFDELNHMTDDHLKSYIERLTTIIPTMPHKAKDLLHRFQRAHQESLRRSQQHEIEELLRANQNGTVANVVPDSGVTANSSGSSSAADNEFVYMTEANLKSVIKRLTNAIPLLAPKLTDKGEKLKSKLQLAQEELQRRQCGSSEENIADGRKKRRHSESSSFDAGSEKTHEAVKLLLQSASAQYQLALCLHKGRGIDQNIPEAAKWYLRAAEGGLASAMYNVSLCYSSGEGFAQSQPEAKKWMKQAANHGHSKAQFEHGLYLFSEGDMMKAVVYLELASRAGEVGASHVKDVILRQLPAASRDRLMNLADQWCALPSSC